MPDRPATSGARAIDDMTPDELRTALKAKDEALKAKDEALKAKDTISYIEKYVLYSIQRKRITDGWFGTCSNCTAWNTNHMSDYGY
jgi:RNA polymerase-binding transcription factor DksA